MSEDPHAGRRPSPDALLAAAERAEGARGRLKIFLGAAPGVGKTYEMLLAAQARRREGTDVVVGVVESHGRAETEALLDGLAILPRRRVDYRGHVLSEMDLDALLARRPALALVDELAHTNAPGSRHPKRYLDVEELLAAGIDVYTTLNIQHVESLNDVVAQITRIRVRETVPDVVLDRADDIEVVDLSPEDLIQRLREGKIYVPKQAERAQRHYFSPGNLTALRELALRRTAQRVDEQLRSHMQAHAIPGPWAAGERVLVCVSEDARAGGLIRYARRLADRLHAPWTALYVETARGQRLGEAERDRIAEALLLAERLGGEALTLPGRAVAEDVLDHAAATNVTHIVLGKSQRPRWFEMVHGSVVHDLIRRAGPISVHVIAGVAEAAAGAGATAPIPAAPRRGFDARPHAFAALLVAAALGLALVVRPLAGPGSLDLIFLVGVLIVAVQFGLLPSLAASVLSMLAYNFFFLPPLYTLRITDPGNLASLLAFLAVAVLASNLGARLRAQAVAARGRARTTEALYAFSRKLAGIADLDDLLWATAYQIASMLRANVVLLLPGDGTLAVQAGYPPEDRLDDADLGAARWAYENDRATGRGADTLPGAKHLFLPLKTGRGVVGVVGIDRTDDDRSAVLSPDERRLFDALADQAAVAIERIRLAQDIDRAHIAAETERLRAALLTSLSHDLKTPLASIVGAASALRQYDALYDAAARAELATTIHDEAERLGRFIVNLLDMTRLESGTIALRRAPTDLGEVIGTALQRLARALAQHRVAVELDDDLPLFQLDAALFEQVLVNLLDNAGKYAPPGTTITVSGRRAADGGATLAVADEGPGIPPGDIARIFEKFHRVSKADHQRAGTGLGLSICAGFVAALGGRIAAANRTDRAGAVFTIALPPALVARPPAAAAAAGTAP